jgi:hypothetical protein
MQLGTRWGVGAEPPKSLPEAVVDAVSQVESELTGIDTSNWRWTLTWLEGRPVVELDDGTIIRLNAAGAAVITAYSDDTADDEDSDADA